MVRLRRGQAASHHNSSLSQAVAYENLAEFLIQQDDLLGREEKEFGDGDP